MPVGDTLVNLIVSGTVAIGLAQLLRVQYEARITGQATLYNQLIADLKAAYEARLTDQKDRIDAQNGKIDALLKSNDQLADAALISANAVRAVAPGRE